MPGELKMIGRYRIGLLLWLVFLCGCYPKAEMPNGYRYFATNGSGGVVVGRDGYVAVEEYVTNYAIRGVFVVGVRSYCESFGNKRPEDKSCKSGMFVLDTRAGELKENMKLIDVNKFLETNNVKGVIFG